ncbi:MobF family relaxase [Kutzneria sp. 744]|uniref:MobF family relaxase n=1 Tax=Kutzneria sp. (strain 744) TaxID=345341 RepID=UPI0004BACFFF|nr:MobF family relaxase [Kutzneria sp. 744]
MAHEAGVSAAEVLGNRKNLVDRYAAMQRLVQRAGPDARMRADHLGETARYADVQVDDVWAPGAFAVAEANLWLTKQVHSANGVKVDKRVPRRITVGNAGYDLTITLDKWASLLLAFASADDAAAIEDILMSAIKDVFDWAEQLLAYGMRGQHGRGKRAEVVQGSGFLGWLMVHRAARPVGGADVGDPHWHVHISIANMTRALVDGEWSTVAGGGRDIMRHAAAIGNMVRAVVRSRLADRYGARFERSPDAETWDLVGLPRETIRRFSKRNTQIKETLVALGFDPDTATATQQKMAEQRSREAKPESVNAPDETLQQIWQRQEWDAGGDPQRYIRHALPTLAPRYGGRPRPDPQNQAGTLPDADEKTMFEADADAIRKRLLNPDTGLTSHSRRFSRADALAAVADALDTRYLTPAAIEAMTDAVLSHPHFIALPPPGTKRPGTSQGVPKQLGATHMRNAHLFTTADVVTAETTILRAAKNSHPSQTDITVDSPDQIDMAVDVAMADRDHSLSREQHHALNRLVTEGRLIDTVNGGPGTGKTTLMRALRVVMESAGYVVRGLATAAVAAHNLEAKSGIPSRTVASLLFRIRAEPDDPRLTGIDMLVLDEANLTEDRDRAALYRWAADHHVRIVEIGDHHQLRGVGVGSLFGRVHEIVGGAELTDNRRQAEEDEREAIAAWRAGQYAHAYTIWAGKGQVVATETGQEAIAAMLGKWWQLREGTDDPHLHIKGLVMLAATNAVVSRLNRAAQAMRSAEGELGRGHEFRVRGGRTLRLHVGDHVVLKKNDRAHELTTGQHPDDIVLNGVRGVVLDITDDGEVLVEWQQETADGDRTAGAVLSPAYLAAGGVELGYAMTVHLSEGLTVQDQWEQRNGTTSGATVLFAAAGADNPAAHVATSRHRGAVYIFAGRDEVETDSDTYERGRPRGRDQLVNRIVAALAQHARNTEGARRRPPGGRRPGLSRSSRQRMAVPGWRRRSERRNGR